MKILRFVAAIVFAAFLIPGAANAQIKGGVVAIPPITANHCAKWVAINLLGDAGSACGGGAGNVVGPASAVDGNVTCFDGTTGLLIKDCGAPPSMTVGGALTSLGGSVTATTILDSIGATRGSILYRGASGWTILTPGISGFFLKSNGSGADPSYASPTAGGTVTSIAQGNGILLSTAPCTATCTISTTITNNAQTGTTYATASTDGGKTVTLVNAGAIAVSLVQANTAGFTAGFGTTYANIGTTTSSGLVTVTAATSVFGNGLVTLKVYPGQVADIGSDSTNYSFTAMSMPLLANNGIIANTSGATNYGIPTISTNITNLLSANPLANTNQTQVFSGQQSDSTTTLSISTATFTPDGTNNNYKITLVHASCPCTLANPSVTPVAGTSGTIEIIQSATGSDVISTWGSQYIYAGGTSTIAFSAGANAIDMLSYYVIDPTHILLSTAALNATH